jgi:hypothetical protein
MRASGKPGSFPPPPKPLTPGHPCTPSRNQISYQSGVTLPFVSHGGSSLLASFIAVGLLLNIGQNRPPVVARE